MLKIKDDIDLKELEKYGYKDGGYGYAKCVMRDKKNIYRWEEVIVIHKEDRIIRSVITNDLTDKSWICDDVSLDHYIYNLEDLVEKVEE